TFSGEDLYESGIYTHTFTNISGCDSVVVLNLLVNLVSDTVLNYEIQKGDSIVIGNSVYKVSGSYTDYLTNYLGCDSVVTLELIVKEDVQVGIRQLSGTFGSVNLFPNPAGEFVTIEFKGLPGEYVIKIVSMEGKLYYLNSTKVVNGDYFEKIGLQRFTPGMYSVIIESGGKFITKKLIVK
ncbi:MAG: T9SS type A sorting domain-containing protein, partial [Prolixibacteraceae bacterium]|nr:T9SS type A sorting domain-containing protein [Prolixibacteraceae bacterium]